MLGLEVGDNDSEQFVELVTADGSRLELFGQGAATPDEFSANDVVAGLLVDDIHAARQELENAVGVEVLGGVESIPGGYPWQQFRAPEGYVYEPIMDPAAGTSGSF